MLVLLINRWLASASPARKAALIECARRIGFARYVARAAMVRAAMVEHEEWYYSDCNPRGSVYTKTGPGFLPAVVWRTLPYVALRSALTNLDRKGY